MEKPTKIMSNAKSAAYHRNHLRFKWFDAKHPLAYNAFYYGWEEALKWFVNLIASRLEVPTYKLGVGENSTEYCRGWNEGQKAAAKELRKFIPKPLDKR